MEETNPQQEVSPEARLEAIFSKTAGAPEREEVDADEGDDEPIEAAESEESDAEAESEESESASEESDEVEYEGKAYKLPKELKDALLRQSDYTRKTQEVAEQRRTVEERAKVVELREKFHQVHFSKVVEAQAVQSQLQQYSQVNWAELAESNPSQYLQLDRQFRSLQDAANRLGSEIQSLGHEFAQTMEAEKQKAQARCIEELRKEYKDKFTPDVIRQLDETGRSYGFTGEELSNIVDPRVIRVLNDAAQYRKLQGSKTLAQKKVSDVKPVQGKTARTAQSSQQTKQINEVRAKLKATGRPSDAEAFLAAKFAKAMR
jgi:hypothetical protein